MNASPRPVAGGPRTAARLTGTAAAVVLAATLLCGVLTARVAPAAAAPAPAAAATAASPAAAATPAETAATDPVPRTTWAVEPSTADGPDGRVSFRLAVDPGGQVADHVTVTNFSDHPATFDVYASDGVVTEDGQFDLLPAGTKPTDGGAWITLGEGGTAGSTQQVEVAAESSVTVPFTVSVPADAAPGDHPAGVVAALSQAEGPGSAVTFAPRVGARVHLRVTGTLAPALAVTHVRATYVPSWNPFAPGALRIRYTVVNEGNVRLGARTQVVGAGPSGWDAHEVSAPVQREVLPGQEVSASVVLDDVWPLGEVSGEVAATPLLVGQDVVDVALEPAAAGFGTWALPWVQLGSLLVLVGSVLAVRRARRRREVRTQARIEAAVAARTAVGGAPVSS